VKSLNFIIFALSIAFLVYIAVENYSVIQLSYFTSKPYIVAELALLATINSALLWLTASSWRDILVSLTKSHVPSYVTWLWLKSNIYKYLPGNIFNYVVRQSIASKRGIPHKILLQSNFIEAALAATVSLMLSSVVLFYNFALNYYFTFLSKEYVYLGLLIAMALYGYLHIYKGLSFIAYWKPVLFYFIFFMGIGGCAYYVLNFQLNVQLPFLLVTAIYSFAWFVGFITPGAPGGIGVRESVFVIFSNGMLNEADAIVLSVVLRFVSIISEVLLYIIASWRLRYLLECEVIPPENSTQEK
jgi:hypothetical protein